MRQFLSLLALALLSVSLAGAGVIYDNGPLVTHPGGGYGGADASRLQGALGMATYGFTATNAPYRMADQFTVPAPGWQVDYAVLFAYQTGSTTTSTFTGAYVQLWDGTPGGGGSVIWGDTTTNRLTSSVFTNIYRDLDANPGASNRPIMANTASIGLFLAPGTYWLDFGLTGSLGSGPFVPPITILGQTTTGDALQWNVSTWAPVYDGGYAQGMPFTLDGTGIPEPSTLALLALGLGGLVALRRRRAA